MGIWGRLKEYRREHGLAYTIRRSGDKLTQVALGTWHRRWKAAQPDEIALEAQRQNPPAAGLLSVTVPVKDPKVSFLEELLQSLKKQTYENWEAILYDGDSRDPAVRDALDRAGREDPRFRVFHANTNGGISDNTNAAIALARGEYIALCDHDDVLSPDALWRMAEVIAREHPDWLYSDEDMMTEGGIHIDPHWKPDFCPEYLEGDNYISHLSVLKKDLILRAGGLRPGYDGSQDHDLYLRCAALGVVPVHVPYTLYTWRKVRSSESRQHLSRCLDASARAAEDAANQDEYLTSMYSEYEQKRAEVEQLAAQDDPDYEEMKARTRELEEMRAEYNSHPLAKAVRQSRGEFAAMMREVNATLQRALNPEGTKARGCSGSCGTCGGC